VSALRALHWPRLWLGLWGLMIAAVVAGSLAPADDLPQVWFRGADKLQHLLGYVVLSGYAAMLFESRRALGAAAAGLVLLGILIEGAQWALTATRHADPADLLANLAGVALGQALGVTRAAGVLQRIDARLSGQG
jgi:VanZ family protein